VIRLNRLFLLLGLSTSIFAKDIDIKQREVDLNLFKNREVLQLAVEQLSRTIPQKIDKYTTLVEIKAEDTTLVYIYEIYTGAKSDEAIKRENHNAMEEAVTLGSCKTSQRFLKSGISIRYVYQSATTKERLFKFDVNYEKCLR
jgi:hypothetical protein